MHQWAILKIFSQKGHFPKIEYTLNKSTRLFLAPIIQNLQKKKVYFQK